MLSPFMQLAARNAMSREDAAAMLRTRPEVLEKFERSYEKHEAARGPSGNLFEINSKQIASLAPLNAGAENLPEAAGALVDRIVAELLAQTECLYWDGRKFTVETFTGENPIDPVAPDEINALPEECRPKLAGQYIRKDVDGPSYPAILSLYAMFRAAAREGNPREARLFYDHFRQGLDILDLDEITYRIIDTYPNSMGNWLPRIAPAAAAQRFFEIPATRIIKIPLPILQLTRLDYMSLGPATLAVVDRYVRRAFSLDPNGDYFVKTGVCSSKFDFRNARVSDPEEIAELGQYLLFNHWQACRRAEFDLSGSGRPVVYGAGTTVEWVVRDFVPSASKHSIYHGMPLRTEYRIFVDFDRNKIIGRNPYWDPAVMKERFERCPDADDPNMVHDSLIYRTAEPEIMERYNENLPRVESALEALLPAVDGLSGQWSVDIMQEGGKFYLIDMALAEDSAFYKTAVPPELRSPTDHDWMPTLLADQVIS